MNTLTISHLITCKIFFSNATDKKLPYWFLGHVAYIPWSFFSVRPGFPGFPGIYFSPLKQCLKSSTNNCKKKNKYQCKFWSWRHVVFKSCNFPFLQDNKIRSKDNCHSEGEQEVSELFNHSPFKIIIKRYKTFFTNVIIGFIGIMKLFLWD